MGLHWRWKVRPLVSVQSHSRERSVLMATVGGQASQCSSEQLRTSRQVLALGLPKYRRK